MNSFARSEWTLAKQRSIAGGISLGTGTKIVYKWQNITYQCERQGGILIYMRLPGIALC